MPGSIVRKALASVGVGAVLLGAGLVCPSPANADPWFSCTSWKSGGSSATGQCTVVTPGHSIRWRVLLSCTWGRSNASSWLTTTSGSASMSTDCPWPGNYRSSRIDSVILS